MSKRTITKAEVKFVSLVKRGANRLPVMYKAEDGGMDLEVLAVKNDGADKGEILAVVYAKGLRDSQGDIVLKEDVIDGMMETFAKNGMALDIHHDEKKLTSDKAFVKETFKVQKGDARFAGMKDYAGNEVDVTGAWAVSIKIEDPELRAAYAKGELNGVSFGGRAKVEVEKSDDEAGLIARMVEFLKTLPSYSSLYSKAGDISVSISKEELAAAVAKASAEAATAAVAAYKAEEAKKAEDLKKADEAAKTEAAAKAAKDKEIKDACDAAVAAAKAEWTGTPAFPPSNQGDTGDAPAAKGEPDYVAIGKSMAEHVNKYRK